MATVIAPADGEHTAVLLVRVPAGAELELEPEQQFVGWLESSSEHSHQLELIVATPALLEEH